MAASPPLIFSPQRRLAARQRAMRLQDQPGTADYLLADMVEDIGERLSFLRHTPHKALVIGDRGGQLATLLSAQGAAVSSVDPALGFAEEQPFAEAGFDFIASIGTLDTVNDLPGALLHLKAALAPGGLVIASMIGAGSLPALRAAMLTADGDRPAPRMHPQVDVRAGGQLLQRAGWSDPVIDSRSLEVRFSSLSSLIADLRAQGLGNVLARPGPPLTRTALHRAAQAFGEKTVERFEILTLSGWRR